MLLFVLFAALAALLAVAAPLQLSFGAVWLFAGPHNWMEARYFLGRLPSRLLVGKRFVLTAAAGTALLGLAFVLAPPSGLWFTGFGLWTLLLLQFAGRHHPALAPLVLTAIALAWRHPGEACIALLFLHQLAALYFLFRHTARRWPQRRLTPYAAALTALAFAVVALHWNTPGLPSIQSFAVLPLAAPFVALHAYLELLHYGAWIVALPAANAASKPWQWRRIPLARRCPSAVAGVLAAGLAAVVLLWAGFAFDYPTARSLYFSIAIFHVLAEVPMLIWLR
jgi:hypothetical protein